KRPPRRSFSCPTSPRSSFPSSPPRREVSCWGLSLRNPMTVSTAFSAVASSRPTRSERILSSWSIGGSLVGDGLGQRPGFGDPAFDFAESGEAADEVLLFVHLGHLRVEV